MRNSIEQYASAAMRGIWSASNRVLVERELWLLIMQLQAELGVAIPAEAVENYGRILHQADLARIVDIENTTKHDLRARLQHFNEQAGHSYAHYGLTSCDITDNATQQQIRASIRLLDDRVTTVLDMLAAHIEATRDVVIAARTHNQPAQLSLLAKRFATVADELIATHAVVRSMYDSMACRGLVGAVGTGQDLVVLMGGAEAYERLNAEFIDYLGYNCRMLSPGQVGHRSEDVGVCNAVLGLVAAPANLARMVRLETGHGRMWETKTDGQVGSSAMPHKRNSITAERINGLANIARGFHLMIQSTMGETWLEGDVSDSVTRRVALPGLFYAVDAVLTNIKHLLEYLSLNKVLYRIEVKEPQLHYSLRGGQIMAELLRRGADRDQVYSTLAAHPFATVEDLPELLRDLPMTAEEIREWAKDGVYLEAANHQVDRVLEMIEVVTTRRK